jgi:hypothetical protein
LDSGADMLSVNNDKWTPLQFAAECRSHQCIKLLIGDQDEEKLDIKHLN